MAKQYTESQKQAAAKWDAEHMSYCTVKADKEFVAEFTKLAEKLGRSRNDCAKEAIQMFMDEYKTI